MSPKISVIIPTYNEKDTVLACIKRLRTYGNELEIIVADSPKSTIQLSEYLHNLDCQYLKCKQAGRNYQMNEGAAQASAGILYFVHADTLVHKDFENDILSYIDEGYDLGSYSFQFDRYTNPLLYINAACTKLPLIWCRGGDQTLFIKKKVFESLRGFCEKHVIMEDYDFLKRANEKGFRFKLIPKSVVVSARKYEKNGYFKVQMANLKVMRSWLKGNSSPQELLAYYRNTID